MVLYSSKNKWTSTGSSIIESTRSELVERIYMLFGSLGSNPPAFKCKPYQDCLREISVTHSPRYTIDMDLGEKESIFSKMHTDYDVFRMLEDKEKYSKLRRYYIDKAKAEGRDEMPWWLGETSRATLSIFNDESTEMKNDLKARAMILFPAVFDSDTSAAYRKICIWLCNRYSLLCYNMRDFFSAGGQVKNINGHSLEVPYPNVVKRVLLYRDAIENILTDPDVEILADISDYWDFEYNEKNLYASWVNMVEKAFKRNPCLAHVPIGELLADGIKPD